MRRREETRTERKGMNGERKSKQRFPVFVVSRNLTAKNTKLERICGETRFKRFPEPR